MVGVDLVPQMVEASRRRGVYDEVVEAEIEPYLKSTDRTFDLIVAADVFIYIGDLAEIFSSAAARVLRPGGLFAFSLEMQEEPGFRLRPSRRYTHNIDYVRELAAANGLAEVSSQRAPLRLEQAREVMGWIVVLRK
jgi:predicted TPR repeat methyltransferase